MLIYIFLDYVQEHRPEGCLIVCYYYHIGEHFMFTFFFFCCVCVGIYWFQMFCCRKARKAQAFTCPAEKAYYWGVFWDNLVFLNYALYVNYKYSWNFLSNCDAWRPLSHYPTLRLTKFSLYLLHCRVLWLDLTISMQ